MTNNPEIQRCFITKKPGFDPKGDKLKKDFEQFLHIKGIKKVTTAARYDVVDLQKEIFEKAKTTIFGEAPVENITNDDKFRSIFEKPNTHIITLQSKSGQYDQTDDSAEQCAQVLTHGDRPVIKLADIVILEGNISKSDLNKIKKHLINPVDTEEVGGEIPKTLENILPTPPKVKEIRGFCKMGGNELKNIAKEYGLAMTFEDILEIQKYFIKKGREPISTELTVVDMYWSDHCRHTTFTTELTGISLDNSIFQNKYRTAIRQVFVEFIKDKIDLGRDNKPISLMEIATFGTKWALKNGHLDDLYRSAENNAAMITVPVIFKDNSNAEYIFAFKNETHNHPTEISPYGGAATCIGGSIRDPLAERIPVLIGMRVTGSSDPRTPVEDTIAGKLSQRFITTEAADGFSSYGNQIGIPTLKTQEYYHKNFVAKRFECGFVAGAARKDEAFAEKPKPGDVVIVLGGRTGLDGVGGATGSSKQHDAKSVETCGAEVQKGNPLVERNILRFFGDKKVKSIIKRCNDMGAGGIANSVGELADGVEIFLDKVKLKYNGLNSTEILISESQERMSVVVAAEKVDEFIALAAQENIEATAIAEITAEKALKVKHNGKAVCNLDRDFLDSGWATREAKVKITTPSDRTHFLDQIPEELQKTSAFEEKWIKNLSRLNVCSQKGLQQQFDSTVGGKTVTNPHGGKNQASPSEAAVFKFTQDSITGMATSIGFNPDLAEWSPFYSGMYSVIESVTKLVASGANFEKARITLQNYFGKLGNDPERWGKPFAAQLGALKAQKELKAPAIGGKDSMSGTFIDENGERIDVPPSIVSFAVASVDTQKTIPSYLQKSGSQLVYLEAPIGEDMMPKWQTMAKQWRKVSELMKKGQVLSSSSVVDGGLAGTISKMSFGNEIGVEINTSLTTNQIFTPKYGSIILEIPHDIDISESFGDTSHLKIGQTITDKTLKIQCADGKMEQSLEILQQKWEEPLEDIFPSHTEKSANSLTKIPKPTPRTIKTKATSKIAKPHVLIPVFPGTNCENETEHLFQKAGASVEKQIFRNLTSEALKNSIKRLAQEIRKSQILMLAGGFSAGDQPKGTGKFIANILRNPIIADAIADLLARDGKIAGFCNGFQALVKSGLLPHGEIKTLTENDLTLTENTLGRYICKTVEHKITSNLSPWLNGFKNGDILSIPIAHGEGRIVAPENVRSKLFQNGQIAMQYTDPHGNIGNDFTANPNGSDDSIAALIDSTGNIFGMMGHPERAGISQNIPERGTGATIIANGVEYFK